MIYLGEQLEALDKFYSVVTCWVKSKHLGRKKASNLDGYKCNDLNCSVCTRGLQKIEGYNRFFEFIIPKLEEIIKAKPDKMLQLELKLRADWWSNVSHDLNEFNDACSEILSNKGYKGWFTGTKGLNYDLAEWLDQHTCTFCNRQYIFTARKNAEEKGMTCQFDHWFDKGSRPLFALSFYNLIPSCSVCNSSVKSVTHFNTDEYLHPYLDKDISSRFKFSSIPNTATQYDITFLNEDKMDAKTKRTLDGLGTKLVYSKHSEKELQDLIDLRMKYSKNYLKNLLENTFDDKLNMAEEEKYRLIFGIELSEDNMHKRPFSKFKKDIIEELLKIK
ncbi:hypothetical protein NBRC110019_03790 [Neptunitalea chrysea]|uniref:HNH endonuclease n=1 Tax=Neptunitalea chrysea TaxID=1647581 RepID=A0A9W6B332_9FLAO|nr:hypothetical protein [Neptunitalea chrysea]GLB51340.1 hypothetical protein NBRC110019_03790 [Neptunitalea chrysea]